jgi:putative ABC transport system permease protein
MALLRAVGATRRQVRRSVLGEAVVVGLLGSAVGLVLGAGVARLLVLLLRGAAGVDMPYPALLPSARTAVVGVLVGTVVTLLASVAPARKATQVAPVQALREALPGGGRPSARRAVAGAATLVLGTGLLAAGLFAGSGVAVVGLGVLVTFLGVTVLLPLLATALSRLLGAPVAALAGTTGRLARENAVRNPNRTASTSAALMIGLALVVTVSILASSLQASIGSAIDDTVKADLVVQQVGGQGAGLSPTLADEVREVPGVEVVSEFAYGRARIDGADTYVAPVDPATVEQVLDLGLVSGSVDGLARDGILVHEDAAEAAGWEVGSEVPVSWASTGDAPLTVAGVFRESDAVGADYLVAMDTYDANATGRLDRMVLVQAASGQDVEQVQADVLRSVRDVGDAEVLTGEQWKDSISGQVDQMLVLVTALLLLAVFIALMGIVNTLALSVLERTRELGLLRAVGMTRRQVRAMVRWESVLIAGIGAVTGTVVGLAFGVALVTALEDEGVPELAVPGPRLAVYVAAAAVAGVLAALAPARRASRVDVLRAVVTD